MKRSRHGGFPPGLGVPLGSAGPSAGKEAASHAKPPLQIAALHPIGQGMRTPSGISARLRPASRSASKRSIAACRAWSRLHHGGRLRLHDPGSHGWRDAVVLHAQPCVGLMDPARATQASREGVSLWLDRDPFPRQEPLQSMGSGPILGRPRRGTTRSDVRHAPSVVGFAMTPPI